MSVPTTSELLQGGAWHDHDPLEDLLVWLPHARLPQETINVIASAASQGEVAARSAIEKLLAKSERRKLASAGQDLLRLALYGAEFGSRPCLYLAAKLAWHVEDDQIGRAPLELAVGLAQRIAAPSEKPEPTAGGDLVGSCVRVGRKSLLERGYRLRGTELSVPLVPDPGPEELAQEIRAFGKGDAAQIAAYLPPSVDLSALLEIVHNATALLDISKAAAEPTPEALYSAHAAVRHSRTLPESEKRQLGRLLSLSLAQASLHDEGWRGALLAGELVACGDSRAQSIIASCATLAWLENTSPADGFSRMSKAQDGRSLPLRLQQSFLGSGSRLREILFTCPWIFEEKLSSFADLGLEDASASTLQFLYIPRLKRSDVARDLEGWLAQAKPAIAAACSVSPTAEGLSPIVVSYSFAERILALIGGTGLSTTEVLLAAARLHAYAAIQGSMTSGMKVALLCRHLADLLEGEEDRSKMLLAAVAWTVLSSTEFFARRNRNIAYEFEVTYALVGSCVRREELWTSPESPDPHSIKYVWSKSALPSPPSEGQPPPSGHGIVVLERVGEAGRSTKDIQKEFRDLISASIPLKETPDLRSLFLRLTREMPNFSGALDAILRDTVASPTVRFRPTVLVGRPGIGKSRLGVRLAQELGLPVRLIPCAGASDGSIGGTSRQWSTGRPCLPLGVIVQTRVGNPLLVLDEIDKVGESRHNGNLADVLLGLLEPGNAEVFWDPYVEAAVNLSKVNWLFTANDIASLHPAFLDRCRIIEVPSPGPDDLAQLIPSTLQTLAKEGGLDESWAPSISPEQFEMIAQLWAGGSIRRLKQIIERVLHASETAFPN